ncbi:MAG: outer membrane lipoprotein carrier protein LolA [Crocinitomicaceae bacterium]|nr:outer membrane lipoprotein carrier protein LolA [Crocinitomicaceae bacterium]
MKTILSLFILTTFSLNLFSQDEKAKKILDEISIKTKAYETMYFEFTVVVAVPGEEPITQSGKVYIKDEKYFLSLTEQEVYCDATTITTFLKEDNECYTRSVEDVEDGEIVSPSQLLTVWEDGYKYKYVQETTYADRPAHEIHLYPKDPSNSKFHTIILKIDAEKNEVVFFMVKGKDGTNTKYKISKFDKNIDISDSKFVFDRAKHPGVVCQEE